MSEYKLKTGKIGKAVVDGYKKVEDAFVDTFLEKADDPAPATEAAPEENTEGREEESK